MEMNRMADTEEKKEEEKYTKNYPYALNTFEDIWKYDKARLLDLGNDFQVLLSQKDEDRNEEARARSNFQKMVEGERRPFSHTMTDAARLLPDVIAYLVGGGIKAGAKVVGKSMAKKPAKKIARKLVNEETSDVAQAFAKSKLLHGVDKGQALKAWQRSMFENKEAMERIAGRKLSDDEIDAIRKATEEFVSKKVRKHNVDTTEYYKVYRRAFPKGKPTKEEMLKYFSENRDSLDLNGRQYRDFMKNLDNLPSYETAHMAHLILNKPGKDKLFDAKDLGMLAVKSLWNPVSGTRVGIKGGEAAMESLKTLSETDGKAPTPVIKHKYDYSGAEPTPVKDFVLGMIDRDLNDPARYNERDIEAIMSMFKEKGFFEKARGLDGQEKDYYVVDTWTPRQKISWLRERLSDKESAKLIKKYWLQSEQRKELLGE
jgi:hypothetical protein